ncbi:MAG: Ig-like domain-containing protein [Acidobacteriaceae bacterium]
MINGLALDPGGNVYMVGNTQGKQTYFVGNTTLTSWPTTPGTYSTPFTGSGTVPFFVKLSPVLLGSATTLTITPTTAITGQSVVFTATVTGQKGSAVPTGTVTFNNGTTALGNGNVSSSGVATFTTSAEPVGTYNVTAAYSGDVVYDPSTSAATSLIITAAPVLASTTTTLAASATSALAGTSITFTGTVKSSGTQTPTGTVTFTDGATTLGTGTVGAAGAVTFATSTLAVGAHSITASYGGDTNNAASVSSALSVTITAPPAEFSLSLSPTSATVAEGSSATTTVSVSPSNGFNAATTFSCSGLPTYSTCTFSPVSVTPSGAAATSTLTIATGVKTAIAALGNQSDKRSGGTVLAKLFAGSGALLAVLFWPGFFGRKRRATWLRMMAVVFLVSIAMQALSGCGSTIGNKTPSGTSSVTVTATSGNLAHTATFTLTVQ